MISRNHNTFLNHLVSSTPIKKKKKNILLASLWLFSLPNHYRHPEERLSLFMPLIFCAMQFGNQASSLPDFVDSQAFVFCASSMAMQLKSCIKTWPVSMHRVDLLCATWGFSSGKPMFSTCTMKFMIDTQASSTMDKYAQWNLEVRIFTWLFSRGPKEKLFFSFWKEK